MAGWLAELKWHRQGSTSHDAELIQILDGHDWAQVLVEVDDEQQVVRALIGNADPEAVEFEDFFAEIYAFRQYAYELISRPAIWRAIRSVARALLSNGKLSNRNIVNVIGSPTFLEVSHGRWIQEARLAGAGAEK